MGRVASVLFLLSISLFCAEITVKVAGMHCIACTKAVKTAILDVQGVREAKVNFRTETAVISMDGNVSIDAVKASVAKTGYKITEVIK